MEFFDLHVHTFASPDAISSPKRLVKKAKKIGLKGFAVTDHNNINSFSRLGKLQKENREILIIQGEEVKIIENRKCVGEILCYFIQDLIKPGSFLEILDKAREQDALTSIAHPFDYFRRGFGKDLRYARKVDLVEIVNARAYFPSANTKAIKFVDEIGFSFTAGSDAHTTGELGNAGIKCNAETEEELRKQLLAKRSKKTFFLKQRTIPPIQWGYSLLSKIGIKESD